MAGGKNYQLTASYCYGLNVNAIAIKSHFVGHCRE